MKERLEEKAASAPEALISLVCECLSPEPRDRPSALQILAVSLKCDTSPLGLQRSESFWQALVEWPDESGLEVLKHFTTRYLGMIISDTTFSPKEVCLLAILATIRGLSQPSVFTVCHSLSGILEGGGIFHALASLPAEEKEIFRLSLEVAKWPHCKALAGFVTQRTKAGLLPSAIAAHRGNIELACTLSRLE